MVVLTTIVGGITQIPHGNQDLHNIHLLNLHVMPPLLRSNHQPPTPSPVEQAILNLSKQVDNFIKEQRAMTVQANQKTDTVESSLDKKLDGLQSEIDKKKIGHIAGIHLKAHQLACSSRGRKSRRMVLD